MNTENNPMGTPEMPPQYNPQQPPQYAQPPQPQPQYQQPQYQQPQYQQPYQQPYQAPVQSRPNMGLYIAACVAHLIFCVFMFLSAFEVIKYVDPKLSAGMLLLGAVSSLFIFIGFKVYCKSRNFSAPCTLLIISQIIYTIIFLLILFNPMMFMKDSTPTLLCGIAMIVAFPLMLIARLIVGGKLIGNSQPGVGLMMIAVAVSQILMIVLGIIHANELQSNSYDAVVAVQRLGAVVWIYYIATTLESLLAIFMFASKK